MNYGDSNSYQGAPQVTYQRPDVNESARYATQLGGQENGCMFSSILSSVLERDDDDSKRPAQEQEVNQAAEAHDRIYNQGGASQASSREMGLAAALHAFKMFSSKGSSGGSPGGSGGSSSELIGLAMGEAMRLLKGTSGSGGSGKSQSEILQAAASMAMKLYASQSGTSGSSGSSGSSGGSGGLNALMGLLGKSGSSSSSGGGTSGGNGGAASLISRFF